jgi:hypothetical protein
MNLVPSISPGQQMTSQDHKSTSQTAQTADRIGAVSAFLLDRDSLLPVVASRLGSDTTFESAIRGGSMSPAIPGYSRLHVQLLGNRVPERGEILYYLADDGFVIHRLVRHVSANSGERYYLTIGDDCLAPDPPIPERRVLGTVIAVETSSGRRPPGSPESRSAFHRFARAVSIPTTFAASRISVSAAARVAMLFRQLENAGRARVGRVLRLVGLLRSR